MKAPGLLSALLAPAVLGCAPRLAVEPASDATVERIVIDTRAPDAFALGHAPGALNLQWGWDQLEDRIQAYVPTTRTPLSLVATSAAEAERAAAALHARGYRDVTLAAETLEEAQLPTWTAAALRAALADDPDLVVLDIRTEPEWAKGAIEGALQLEQDEAPGRASELDRGRRYAVICEAGYRSSQLASWMLREGFEDVTNVIDGMAGWRALD